MGEPIRTLNRFSRSIRVQVFHIRPLWTSSLDQGIQTLNQEPLNAVMIVEVDSTPGLIFQCWNKAICMATKLVVQIGRAHV